MAVSNMAKRERQEREFAFTNKDFETVRSLLKDKTGISLSDRKTNMMYSRLARRLRATGLKSFADYVDLLQKPEGEGELAFLINAMTTNLTRFYREGHHFEHLMDKGLPERIRAHESAGAKRLRLWSAGCSSGQEPYTIASCVEAVMPKRSGWDVKILATDLDTDMLTKGRQGIYPLEALEDMPVRLRKALKSSGCHKTVSEDMEMGKSLKDLVFFKQLNFLNSWPVKGPFDIIFCRNVMIYFEEDFKRKICTQMVDLLVPGGYFYIGHSESLLNMNLPVRAVGGSTYQKIA